MSIVKHREKHKTIDDSATVPITYSHLNKEVGIPCTTVFFLSDASVFSNYFGLFKGTLSPFGSNPVGKIASELGTINAQCYYWTTFSNYTLVFYCPICFKL